MDDSYRLLTVGDEPDILQTSRRYLEAWGYHVDTIVYAADALELLKSRKRGAVLLDMLLLDMNGFTLCETARMLTSMPALFLSCMDGEEDGIKGLMADGENCITKPYSLKELAVRVYTRVRHGSIKRLIIDHRNWPLQIDNQIVPLSQKEFELFLFLMGHSGQTLSAAELYQEVRRTGKPDNANTVVVHTTRLRHRPEDAGSVVGRIKTARGGGYHSIPKLETKTTIRNSF